MIAKLLGAVAGVAFVVAVLAAKGPSPTAKWMIIAVVAGIAAIVIGANQGRRP